jgi:hypothetical protein
MVQERGHMLALSFFVYHTRVWLELITINWFRAVWCGPSFFHRNHTIQRMSRVWHQPSQVGKTQDWIQCWKSLGSSEHVSDHTDVTVAKLFWLFGTQQVIIFWCLGCHNCGDIYLFHWGRFFIIWPNFRVFPSSFCIMLLPNECFGKHRIKINE